METLFFIFQVCAQFLVFFIVLLRGRKPTGRFRAVEDFDFERFSGTWYVAAHVPSPFAGRLIYMTTEYCANEDGSVRLVTRGWNTKKKEWQVEENKGQFHESEGEGWFDLDCDNPFHQTRKVIYLNEDYSQAIIVGMVMRNVWLVYRNPDTPKREIDALMARAGDMGFRTKRIMPMDQSRQWEGEPSQVSGELAQ